MSRCLIPNSTQIPDVILDEWMPHLSGAELSVVMLVARKTYGWGKKFDRISLTQMEEGTGLARSTVASTCERLRCRGMLQIAQGEGKKANAYMLNLEWAPADFAPDCTENATSTKIELVRKSAATIPEIEPFTSTKIEPTRNKERDKETEQRPKKDVARRAKVKPALVPVIDSPPTLAEVEAFCSEEGFPGLGQAALDFQTTRGWQMKSGPVYDWRSAVRTWKRKEDQYAERDGRQPARASPNGNGSRPAAITGAVATVNSLTARLDKITGRPP